MPKPKPGALLHLVDLCFGGWLWYRKHRGGTWKYSTEWRDNYWAMWRYAGIQDDTDYHEIILPKAEW